MYRSDRNDDVCSIFLGTDSDMDIRDHLGDTFFSSEMSEVSSLLLSY